MRQTWSKAAVAEAIRAHVHQGHAVEILRKQDPHLYVTAKRRFGSWRRALHAAGFQPRVSHAWTKEEILAFIRRYHAQGVPFHLIGRREPRIAMAARHHFGTWRHALQEAGVDADLVQIWSKPKIIEMLRKRHRSPAEKRSRRKDRQLRWAAREYFGSMEQALKAAGIKVPRRWSAARVLAGIQERSRQGLPLKSVAKSDSLLYQAALRYFGGWKKALVAVGFPVKFPRKWTKQSILEVFQTQARKGLSPREIWRQDPLLRSAARSHFGSQEEVMKVLGLPPLRNRPWNKNQIIAEIQALHRQGLPLKRFCSQQNTLYRAACHQFGCWSIALQAAGYKVQTRQRWSKERVIQELQAHYCAADYNISRVHPNLARAAAQLFGSLDQAWEALGIHSVSPRRWSKERIIEAIQDGYVQGLPIHIRGFHNRCLAYAANRYFGSWRAAVLAAGISADLAQKPFRSWSREKVLAALQAHKQQGLSFNSVWREDAGLHSQAKYYFGTWQRAIQAASGPALEGTED